MCGNERASPCMLGRYGFTFFPTSLYWTSCTVRTGNDNDQLGEDAEPDLEDVAK